MKPIEPKVKVQWTALALIVLALALVLRQKFFVPMIDPGAACPLPAKAPTEHVEFKPRTEKMANTTGPSLGAAAAAALPGGGKLRGADESTPPAANGKLAPPELDAVRAAVAHNPHVTPKIILDFSHVLAVRMTAATSDEGKARELFDELHQCVVGPGVAVSVRVMCLGNARRLGRTWPGSLGSATTELEGESPRSVLSMSRDIDEDD